MEAITFMQSQTYALFAFLNGAATMNHAKMLAQINAALRPQSLVSPHVTPEGEAMLPNGGRAELYLGEQRLDFILANAVANQIASTIADEAPWKRCSWCGNYFKKKRSRTDWGRKQSSSKYCCEKCLQKMKDFRRGRTAPPKWWTQAQIEAEWETGKKK